MGRLEEHRGHPNRERTAEIPQVQLQRGYQPKEPRAERQPEAERYGRRSIVDGFWAAFPLRKLLLSTIVMALSVAHPDVARAQEERPPYPAIFGGAVAPNSRESLDLSTSFFGGYDSNQIAGTTGSGFSPIAFQSTGPYSGLGAELAFGTNGKTFDIQARAGTDLRYYSELDSVIVLSNHGGVDFFIRGRSVNARIGQSISYLPSNLGNLFARPPTSAVPGPPDVLPSPD